MDCSGDRGSVTPEGGSQQGFKVARLTYVFCFDFDRTPYRAEGDVVLHYDTEVVEGLQMSSSHESPQVDSVLLRHQIQDVPPRFSQIISVAS